MTDKETIDKLLECHHEVCIRYRELYEENNALADAMTRERELVRELMAANARQRLALAGMQEIINRGRRPW